MILRRLRSYVLLDIQLPMASNLFHDHLVHSVIKLATLIDSNLELRIDLVAIF